MVRAAAILKVGANGSASQIMEARPWENAIVRTTPMRRAISGAVRNDMAASS